MRKDNRPPLPPELQEELRRLEEMPDHMIDFSDIPPTTDWSSAVRGKYAHLGPMESGPDPVPASKPQRKLAS